MVGMKAFDQEKTMMVKAYFGVWVLGLTAVLVTFMTGNMSPTMTVAFGFMSFGAIFMGMMGVLPTTVVHHDGPAQH